MEHFCTLFIFLGLFFQLFGHFVYANSYRKTHILQSREIYSIYEDNRRRKIATTKDKLFSYLGRAAEKGGGGGAGGQIALGPKQLGAPNLRNILKLNKAPSKSGRVQSINGCIKGMKGPVYRYSQRFEVLSTGS